MLTVALAGAPGWMGPAMAGSLRRGATVGRVLDGVGNETPGSTHTDVVIFAVSSNGAGGGGIPPLSGLRHALGAASASGTAAVVLVSHATAYGAWSTNPVPLSEDAPLRPVPGFAHGVTRAEAERLVGEWQANGAGRRVAILRTAPIVDRPVEDRLSRALLWQLRLPGRDGGPPVQFVHAGDVIAAVVAAATTPMEGPFNVAPDGWLGDEDLRGLLGGPARLALPSRLGRPLARLGGRIRAESSVPHLEPYLRHPWVVANDRLRSTGWRPAYSNEEALVMAILRPGRRDGRQDGSLG